MTNRMNSPVAAALAISLGVMLSGCASITPDANMTLNSVAQPVVESQNFTIDLASGPGGLPAQEARRLAGWFDTVNLGYGDRVAIDGENTSTQVYNDVSTVLGHYGILLSAGAPVTEGYVERGTIRVVVTRSHAYVPDCPNWKDKWSTSATTSDFGCAINSNYAAMVADPQHLLHGDGSTGGTVVMSSTKAIDTYREQKPTGAEGLPAVSTQKTGSN